MAMLPHIDCHWDLTPAAARALQRRLAERVILTPLLTPPRLIAGADTSYNRGSNRVAGAVVVWDRKRQKLVETQTAVVETPFPYIPGLLSFREAPALMPAFAALRLQPDVVMFNGHGIAHPLRFGLACHLGVVFDVAAIGVAQKLLCGSHDPVGPRPGNKNTVMLDYSEVGHAIRTRRRCNPVYVSPGHRIDLAQASEIVRATTYGYKLPVAIREAHLLANRIRRSFTEPPGS